RHPDRQCGPLRLAIDPLFCLGHGTILIRPPRRRHLSHVGTSADSPRGSRPPAHHAFDRPWIARLADRPAGPGFAVRFAAVLDDGLPRHLRGWYPQMART